MRALGKRDRDKDKDKAKDKNKERDGKDEKDGKESKSKKQKTDTEKDKQKDEKEMQKHKSDKDAPKVLVMRCDFLPAEPSKERVRLFLVLSLCHKSLSLLGSMRQCLPCFSGCLAPVLCICVVVCSTVSTRISP